MHWTQWRTCGRWAGLMGPLLLAAMGAGCGSSGDDYVPGRAYWSVVAADLNGDGLVDIAGSWSDGGVPPHPGHVSVFLQDAATPGRFLAPQIHGVGNDPFALTAGDFNGDGRIDLATDNKILATSGAGIADISVLLQSAGAPGTFVASISCRGVYGSGLPAPADPSCATLNLPGDFSVNTVRMDLDGDGLVDQAIANRGSINPGCTAFDCYTVDSYVAVILQNPAMPGTPLAATQYLPSDGGFITWVAAADIDGDGRPDLVIGQSNGLYVRHQDASRPGRFLDAVLIAR